MHGPLSHHDGMGKIIRFVRGAKATTRRTKVKQCEARLECPGVHEKAGRLKGAATVVTSY